MTLAPGTQLGPYEILEPVGAGGMGEVYRARDPRLDRDVALKVLHPGIADNPTRRARFEREAHAISRLSHPNICAVYDVGDQDGVAYLVMEYLDGESLEQRLRRGALPATLALKLSIQIADALDAAHRRGIVHRDLKPANVMLSGQHVKLLDFGLAKIRADDDVDAATALDATKSLTTERTLLGTLHYMAPEQLEGCDTDARTDLFAFGAVLHEMLTARKVFDGASVASVMAAILTAEPASVSSSATGESVPPAALDRVVRRALAKRPDERWQTACDLMNQLQWVLEDGSRSTPAPAPSPRRVRHVAFLAIGAVAALAGLAALAPLWGHPQPVAAPVHLSFFRPAGTTLTNEGRPVLTISPDGRKIVFSSDNQLFLRSLDASESVAIPDTQSLGLETPFFSPDGRWVAFFEVLSPPWEPAKESVLKRVPIDGGGAVEICRLQGGNFGASWTVNDQILFATQHGVFTVVSSGGRPQKIVALKPGEAAHGPQLLPDRDHVLLTVTSATGPYRWDKAQIIVQSLSSGARTVLIEGGADGRYLNTGHIVYAVGTALLAVAADVRSFRILGTPVPILEGVRRAGAPANLTAAAFAAISQTGSLAYVPDAPARSINASVDLDGRLTPLPHNGLRFVRVSPDGSQVVAMSPGEGEGLWIYPVRQHAARRQLAPDGFSATWTSDGTGITYRSQTESGLGLFWQRADGSGPAKLLVAVGGRPIGWSIDDKTLFYMFRKKLWSWTRGEEPRPLLSIDSAYASLSPDRQWVAFHTFENGHAVTYVQSVSNPGARYRISKNGAYAPLWSPDGKKMFYVSEYSASLMSVDIQTTPAVEFREAKVLLPKIDQLFYSTDRNYDITPDGTHLLVEMDDPANLQSAKVEVVLGWFEELKRRVPTR